MKTESQEKQILNHLEKGACITQYSALKLFNCFRLSARIDRLKKQGHPIESEMFKTQSGKYISKYFLKKN